MTNLPDDHIDPYESRLTRRVGAFADQAVRPIDAAAIASAVHAGARRQTLLRRLFGSNGSMGRVGLVIAGALLAAGSVGVYVSGGGPTPTPNPPDGTPISGLVRVPDCTAKNLTAEIFVWEGAAGHRIATVRLLDLDAGCLIPRYPRPALVDGDGHALIVGSIEGSTSTIALTPGARVETLVDMSNYCGAAPTSQLFLRLYLSSDESVDARPAASISDPIDPPPCNGPTVPATIQIQPITSLMGS